MNPHKGLARLAQLREEAASREREVPARGVAADPPANIPSTAAEKISLLRATVAELRRVFDGSLGTTDRHSSSNRDVWEDGDVDRRCRCRFESFPAVHPYGLRGVRVGAASTQDLLTVNRTLSVSQVQRVQPG